MGINEQIKDFFDGLGGDDVVEERVIDYVIEEIEKDRRLADILEDPYVRNRLTEERRQHLLENPDIIETVDREVRGSFDEMASQQ